MFCRFFKFKGGFGTFLEQTDKIFTIKFEKFSQRILDFHIYHCSLKSVQIRSFLWSVFSSIQSKYRKIRTSKNSAFGHFSHSVYWWLPKIFYSLKSYHKLRTSEGIWTNTESYSKLNYGRKWKYLIGIKKEWWSFNNFKLVKIKPPPFGIRTKKCLIVLIIFSNIATSAILIYDLFKWVF